MVHGNKLLGGVIVILKVWVVSVRDIWMLTLSDGQAHYNVQHCSLLLLPTRLPSWEGLWWDNRRRERS